MLARVFPHDQISRPVYFCTSGLPHTSMLASITRKKDSRKPLPGGVAEVGSDDLKLISELGRSLLVTVHPKKVACRVAEAMHDGVGAEAVMFVAQIPNIGLINCSFDGQSNASGADLLHKDRFERWLQFLPPQVGYVQDDPAEFFLTKQAHQVEYISPLHVNGEIKGAVIVAFSEKDHFNTQKERFIDAATQLAAMSLNLSTHYESALHDSINQTREEHRKFTESVLDALPVSLYVVDREFKIVTWNRQRENGLQGIPRDSAIGRDIFQVLAKFPQGRLQKEFERAFKTGRIERIEQQTVEDDGSTKHWLVSKIPMKSGETDEITHVITVGEDVTMRVEAIHAVGRAEKLAAVGRLAAGVVHEINNPLATIAACAEALEHRLEEGEFAGSDAQDDLEEYLSLIKSEAFRCKSITTGLLDFSRSRTGERHPTDLVEVLKSSANLISHQKRGSRIEIEIDAGNELPKINADGGQLQQAVIALATNAIDAMPNGGTLTFRAFSRSNSVTLEIEDTGVGIPAEDLPKVFEPFFTTKEVGKGTGLGLAVCYGIITEHGGRLSVRSNVGKGSTFSILLPVPASSQE